MIYVDIMLTHTSNGENRNLTAVISVAGQSGGLWAQNMAFENITAIPLHRSPWVPGGAEDRRGWRQTELSNVWR